MWTRALLRSARAEGRLPATALQADEGLTDEERENLTSLRSALARAGERRASALDAFAALWRDLQCSRRLVARVERAHEARVDLEAVVDLARAVEAAAGSPDPSIEAFLGAVEAAEGAPELAGDDEPGRDAVRLLTAHASTGLGFDTVFVVGAIEAASQPRRPEPMFGSAALTDI
jgi:superfamily I DNA/RNA helicase